jgi:hypothetical protein
LPVTEDTWLMPEKLEDTIVGPKTALEINWSSQKQE